MKGYEELKLDTIQGGIAVKLFDEALPEIVANLDDDKTDLFKTRKIIIAVEFTRNKKVTNVINVQVSCDKKLAPKLSDVSSLGIGLNEGELMLFSEQGKQGTLINLGSTRSKID